MSLKDKIKNASRETLSSLDQNKKPFFLVVVLALIFMFAVCWITFFATVRGSEQVMVPNVEGKELTTALLELQAKELYPKIQLRYSEEPFGTILNQNPDFGAIVKAGTRVTLTVSRGAVVTEVGEYIGLKFDDVKLDLSTMFTGSSRALIVLDSPAYKADLAEAGTILEQDPPAGTKISNSVTVHLVVSSGPNFENTRVPSFIGKSVQEMIALLPSTKLVFDFSARKATNDEKNGLIVEQQKVESEFVPNYTRIAVEFAFAQKSDDDLIYGIFETKLTDYPYPVAMTLEALQKDGMRSVVASMNHTGGNVTVPYAVPAGTELILKVAGKEAARKSVGK